MESTVMIRVAPGTDEVVVAMGVEIERLLGWAEGMEVVDVAGMKRATDDLVLGLGPKIEHSPMFPARTNVEFIEIISPTEVRQRTWERGSGETLACGTGASAVCVAGVLTGRTKRKIINHLRGGDLELEWRESDGCVYKTGPAVEVFSGDWPE